MDDFEEVHGYKRSKRIIFRQGDKNELEEITGEEFDFVRPPKTYEPEYEESREGQFGPTFVEAFVLRREYEDESTLLWPMDKLRDRLIEIDADAVIHYHVQLTPGHDIFVAYASGTPVCRKRS